MSKIIFNKGFTLIELVITVAILGIIAGVAVPAYTGYITGAKRSAAKSVLLEASSRQENILINDRSYTLVMTDLGYASDPFYVNEKGDSVSQANSVYKIAAAAATTSCPIASCFSLEAVPQNGMTGDSECATFTLSSLGIKNATGSRGAACW